MGAFPLLLLVVIAYNIVVFFGGGVGDSVFAEVVYALPMLSGDPWQISLGGIFLATGLVLLLLELVKSAQIGGASQVNHALSLLVFMICLVEFIVVEGFSNDVFAAIMVMTFTDVVAGYTVAIRAARRDYGIGGG